MPHHANQTSFKKGHIPWLKGRQHSEEAKAKMKGPRPNCHGNQTSFKKGQMPVVPFQKGNKLCVDRKLSEQSIEKMKDSLKGKHLSIKTEIKKGQRISQQTEFNSERVKSWWQDPEYRAKVIAGRLKNRRPTEPERKFIEIIKRHNLPFKYTGDGSFILEGLNPDFVEVNGRKVAIDIFGNYWHTLKADKESYTEEGRKRIFKKFGWELIVIWESELNSKSDDEIVKLVTCQKQS